MLVSLILQPDVCCIDERSIVMPSMCCDYALLCCVILMTLSAISGSSSLSERDQVPTLPY